MSNDATKATKPRIEARKNRGLPLTVHEAAERMNVSSRTISRLIRSGSLPAHRLTPNPHGAVRVFEADIDAYLANLPRV
jgi:excisionase family DNA binding protein